MWEVKQINVKELGEKLYLDSGTLTPLLKKLESKDYVKRERSKHDERNLIVTITEKGEALKSKAVDIPEKVSACITLSEEKAQALYSVLYEILDSME
jgi:DNA-binding MarR family transcriptional regulator